MGIRLIFDEKEFLQVATRKLKRDAENYAKTMREKDYYVRITPYWLPADGVRKFNKYGIWVSRKYFATK